MNSAIRNFFITLRRCCKQRRNTSIHLQKTEINDLNVNKFHSKKSCGTKSYVGPWQGHKLLVKIVYLLMQLFTLIGMLIFGDSTLIRAYNERDFSQMFKFQSLVLLTNLFYFIAALSDPGKLKADFQQPVRIVVSKIGQLKSDNISITVRKDGLENKDKEKDASSVVGGEFDNDFVGEYSVLQANLEDSIVNSVDCESGERLLYTSNSVPFEQCKFCKQTQPLRARHCFWCGGCSYKFDHHCPFIGNCVAGNNQRYFQLFLFLQILTMSQCLSIIWSTFSTIDYSNIFALKFLASFAIHSIQLMYTAFLLLLSIGLTSFQTFLIVSAITSHEIVLQRHYNGYPYPKYLLEQNKLGWKKGLQCFSRGVFKNIYFVLLGTTYTDEHRKTYSVINPDSLPVAHQFISQYHRTQTQNITKSKNVFQNSGQECVPLLHKNSNALVNKSKLETTNSND